MKTKDNYTFYFRGKIVAQLRLNPQGRLHDAEGTRYDLDLPEAKDCLYINDDVHYFKVFFNTVYKILRCEYGIDHMKDIEVY